MKYPVNQKVTIQSADWYEQNKQGNGFIIFRSGNKIATFSPGMLKFCGKTFTIGKVVTGSSIYPDHYTFIEDGGSYKWTDDMIAGLADATASVYNPETDAPKPTPKPVEKPAEKPTPKPDDKPTPKPAQKADTKPAKVESVEKPEMKPDTQKRTVDESPEPKHQPMPESTVGHNLKETPSPMNQPKPELAEQPQSQPAQQPAPQPQPAQQPAPQPQQMQEQPEEFNAFESYTILLKPRQGAKLQDCAVQAFKIIHDNEIFPSVTFDFNNFDFTITRK